MNSRSGALGILLILGLAGCASPGVTRGAGGADAQGAAAGANAEGVGDLERCDQTLGTLAVDDGREERWYSDFARRTQVTSIEPMIRLLAQQSNCFVVTSLGDRRLTDRFDDIVDRTRNSGDFREGSNYQAGQQVAADFFLQPTVLFADSDTGGVFGGVGGLIGTVGALAGAALDSSSTTVNLSLFGIREGVQLAASEGSASVSDLSGLFGLFGGGVGGVLGGYQRTPEGKSTVAAFVDAYNQMVVALRNYQAQEVEGGLGTGGQLQVGQ